MDQLNVLLEPLRGLLQQVGGFVPRIAVAAVIVLVGWGIAKGLRFSVAKALRSFNFHVVTQRAGIDEFLQQGGSERDACDLFGAIAFWLAIFAALMIAFSGLGLDPVTGVLGKVLLFFPRLVVALLIVIFGSYFARFVGQAASGHCKSAGIGDAELVGRLVQYALMAFVLLLAIDHLDIGGGLIQRTFLILLGGVVLALALAFGIGGRDRAAALIERWFPRDRGSGR